ncbi:MAG: hypothetical protein Q9184_001796 [Pyrenodesmia sp. 2 TL-2023]
MCSDGSFCCNDDALCCSKKEGKFIDARGNLISNPYTIKTSQSATTSTSSQPQPTSAVAAATTPATPTASASTSSGLSAAIKGIIGALAGVLVLVAIAASFLVWRARRKRRKLKTAPTQLQPTVESYDQALAAQKQEMGYGPAELRVLNRVNTDGPRELASDHETSRMRELASDPVPSRMYA